MQIFNRWLPKAESHLELIESIKIMFIHDNGVIITSIFALMAKLEHGIVEQRSSQKYIHTFRTPSEEATRIDLINQQSALQRSQLRLPAVLTRPFHNYRLGKNAHTYQSGAAHKRPNRKSTLVGLGDSRDIFHCLPVHPHNNFVCTSNI